MTESTIPAAGLEFDPHLTRVDGVPASIEEALRDAIVTAQIELSAAIEDALPDEPADDQRVQWWAGHVAMWRRALGDSQEQIADDYDALVLRASEGHTVPGRAEF